MDPDRPGYPKEPNKQDPRDQDEQGEGADETQPQDPVHDGNKSQAKPTCQNVG